MEGQSLSTWLAITGVFCGAGVLRGFTGFGFALVAVPFGALWIAPDILLPVVFLLHIYMGVFEVRSAVRSCHGPSMLWLIVGGALGTPIGVYALVIMPLKAVYIVIGSIVLASIVLLLLKPSTRRFPLGFSAIAGVFSGIFNGMAAMPGPPAIFYFMRGGFSNAETRSSLILFFFVTAVYAIMATIYVGLLSADEIFLSLVVFPIIALSTWMGAGLFRRYGQKWYRVVGASSLISAAIAAFAKALSL